MNSEKTFDISDADGFKRMLILEDDDDLVRLLVDFLEEQRFKVTTVKDGVAGIREVMATDFDVILCDLLMPNLPGDMFYLAVERTRPHLCSRFIFMTGHRGHPRVEAFFRTKRGVMLWKPFQLFELMEAIKIIQRKALEPAAAAH